MGTDKGYVNLLGRLYILVMKMVMIDNDNDGDNDDNADKCDDDVDQQPTPNYLGCHAAYCDERIYGKVI